MLNWRKLIDREAKRNLHRWFMDDLARDLGLLVKAINAAG